MSFDQENTFIVGHNVTVSSDPQDLDFFMIHKFLSTEAYWCKNIPADTLKRSIANSLNFGLFEDGKQVGYARVISDFATIAYLGDVFVLPAYRGKGYSKLLMQTVMNHTSLKGLRRWILLTGDAHGLYRQFGWQNVAKPERWMELHNAQAYPSVTV